MYYHLVIDITSILYKIGSQQNILHFVNINKTQVESLLPVGSINNDFQDSKFKNKYELALSRIFFKLI